MPNGTTTKQKVMNYVRRCCDRDELREIAKEIDKRRAAIHEEQHDAVCQQRFDAVRQAAVIVRDHSIAGRVFLFRDTPAAFRSDRWYVREEYRGRKYRGVFVSAEANTPRSRKGWHFLSWRDCDCWKPEEVAEAAS